MVNCRGPPWEEGGVRGLSSFQCLLAVASSLTKTLFGVQLPGKTR